MDTAASILQWARKVQAIAQNGLTFTQDPFDRERFEQLQQLVTTILTAELRSRQASCRACGLAMKALRDAEG